MSLWSTSFASSFSQLCKDEQRVNVRWAEFGNSVARAFHDPEQLHNDKEAIVRSILHSVCTASERQQYCATVPYGECTNERNRVHMKVSRYYTRLFKEAFSVRWGLTGRLGAERHTRPSSSRCDGRARKRSRDDDGWDASHYRKHELFCCRGTEATERMWIYVISAVDGDNTYYYIGQTKENQFTQRVMLDHLRHEGHCEWTMQHGSDDTPLTWTLQFCGEVPNWCLAGFWEDLVTKMVMAKHGVKMVRGGSYCALLITRHEARINREIWHALNKCFYCGGAEPPSKCPSKHRTDHDAESIGDHKAKECSTRTAREPYYEAGTQQDEMQKDVADQAKSMQNMATMLAEARSNNEALQERLCSAIKEKGELCKQVLNVKGMQELQELQQSLRSSTPSTSAASSSTSSTPSTSAASSSTGATSAAVCIRHAACIMLRASTEHRSSDGSVSAGPAQLYSVD